MNHMIRPVIGRGAVVGRVCPAGNASAPVAQLPPPDRPACGSGEFRLERASTKPGGLSPHPAYDMPAGETTSQAAGAGRRTVLHFTPSIGGGGAEAMLVNLVLAMDGARWRRIVVVVNGSAWPETISRLRDAGVEVHDLGAPAFLCKAALSGLTRLLRQTRPDVVQTWMHHADFIGGWCARLAGVRHVVWGVHCREIHRNPGDSDFKMRVFRWLLGASSHVVPARVVSCSAAALEEHMAWGYPRASLEWVPNGILTRRFGPSEEIRAETRRRMLLPADAPVVGFVGRFHEMKDLPTWLRAAALLQTRRPETHFWLCGLGEQELDDAARAALSIMPRRAQVHFTPFSHEPEKVYPALDVFSLSSRTEACPMTVIEALSCGTPCVTTDVGDCARLIEKAGCVVPAGDAEALARAWEEVLAAPRDARALHERAVERFDIATAARAYERIYEEVIAG